MVHHLCEAERLILFVSLSVSDFVCFACVQQNMLLPTYYAYTLLVLCIYLNTSLPSSETSPTATLKKTRQVGSGAFIPNHEKEGARVTVWPGRLSYYVLDRGGSLLKLPVFR